MWFSRPLTVAIVYQLHDGYAQNAVMKTPGPSPGEQHLFQISTFVYPVLLQCLLFWLIKEDFKASSATIYGIEIVMVLPLRLLK